MGIGQRPPVSIVITNNFLIPNTKATNPRVSSRAIAATYNKFENFEDGSFGMKHLERWS
jgi:hypothetical protein